MTERETVTSVRTLTCANCSLELYSGSGSDAGPADFKEDHGKRFKATSILGEPVEGTDAQTCDKQNETQNVPVPDALNFILHLPYQNALTCYISLCEECAGVVTHIYRFYKLLESKAKPDCKLNSVFKEISSRVHQSLSIYPLDDNDNGKENFLQPSEDIPVILDVISLSNLDDNTSELGHSPQQIDEEEEDPFWENMNYIKTPAPWSPPSPDLDDNFPKPKQRGRPKKVVESVNGIPITAEPKVKRRRGAPRKWPADYYKGKPRKGKRIGLTKGKPL